MTDHSSHTHKYVALHRVLSFQRGAFSCHGILKTPEVPLIEFVSPVLEKSEEYFQGTLCFTSFTFVVDDELGLISE